MICVVSIFYGKIMDVNKQLTDLERVELTKKSYTELSLGERVTIGNHFIGFVTQSVYEEDGLRAFVIANPNEITVLFKGSYGFKKGNPTTWRDEWLKTNVPILLALLTNERKIPSQLKTAARLLNQVLRQYRDAHFYIYGHSLGSINAQYALANCHHPERIVAAYLYEGTNIWLLLNEKERRKVAQMREKIFNYVDIYDPVTLGITSTHHMVGQLRYIDSEPMKQPIKQHMWGGYRFNEDGSLKLRKVDEEFLRESHSERKLLTRSGDMTNFLMRMSQSDEIKKMAIGKIDEIASDLTTRYPDNESLLRLAALFRKKEERNTEDK